MGGFSYGASFVDTLLEQRPGRFRGAAPIASAAWTLSDYAGPPVTYLSAQDETGLRVI